jgi:hypothetical protein
MKSLTIFAKYFLPWALFFTGIEGLSYAQIISPKAMEVKFSYEATFIGEGTRKDALDLADLHNSHMFGILTSPTLVRKYRVDPDLIEGLGGPQAPAAIKILKTEQVEANAVQVTYRASGMLLLHKNAAHATLKAGVLTLPLPADLRTIYDVHCTDDHYNTPGDYWYFYDPFRRGCERLSREPLAHNVDIRIRPASYRALDTDPRLDLLRANNGNGDVFSIYVIHGFDEGSTARADIGRKNFKLLNEYLEDKGFEKQVLQAYRERPVYLYTKEIETPEGKTVEVQITHSLVESEADSRAVSFAKFFKEGVENADVLIYGGHSGLGGNLDIPTLETKAGKFKFNKNKRQIFYFDSCSSYSYYLDAFRSQKTKSKLDVITNGLSSFWETSPGVLDNLMDELLDFDTPSHSWERILEKMEKGLGDDGSSVLVNVGGV